MNVINLDDLKHGVRVANYSCEIAKYINFYKNSIKRLNNVYISGIFHDIGKAYINQDIINKPGKLTSQERIIIQKHPFYSYNEIIEMGYCDEIADNILHHHENFDGSGYPDHLKGNEIPIGARILKICDVFDALLVKRPYRNALSIKEALIIMNSEKQNFDPYVYNVFMSLVFTQFNIFNKSNSIIINTEPGEDNNGEYASRNLKI